MFTNYNNNLTAGQTQHRHHPPLPSPPLTSVQLTPVRKAQLDTTLDSTILSTLLLSSQPLSHLMVLEVERGGGDFYIRKLMNHADSVKYLLYFVSFSFIEIRRICFKILFWKCILFVCCWLLPSLNTEIYIVWNMKFPEVQRTSARRIIYPWGSQQGIFSKEISSG